MKLRYCAALICVLIACALSGAAMAAAPEATAHPTPPTTTLSPGATKRAEPAATSHPTPPATSASEPSASPEPSPTPGGMRLAGMIIGLDPGHQAHANRDKEPLSPGSDEMKAKVSSGTQGVSTRINEYETDLTIALKLRDRLVSEGAQVVMTRETNDVDISNVERAQLMNAAGVDIWLRIHCNGSSNGDVHGMSMYVRKTGPYAEESLAAGELLLDEMCAATGAKSRGVHATDTYSGNNWSERPCVLVEMGYMTNAHEDELLNDPDYQQKLIEGYVNALERWNRQFNRLTIVQPECDGVM